MRKTVATEWWMERFQREYQAYGGDMSSLEAAQAMALDWYLRKANVRITALMAARRWPSHTVRVCP